ncbi:hypothetical protein K439DRAFT_1373609 [Ramaria rubella]|nr:hypothetical protein K439DRAFT_1373609 [Ramaria rubella]
MNTNAQPSGFGALTLQTQPQQQQQQQQQQPQAGLFGTAQSGSFGGGGSFGNSTAGTGTGGFGNPGTNTGGNNGGTGGGLFGNTNTTANANTGTPSGGLFGNTNTNTNTATGAPSGGVFGTTNTNTNTVPNAPTGGLFGNNTSNATPSTSNLFGQPSNPSPFSQPQQQPQQQPSIFGSFGQNQNQGQSQNQTQPGFGSLNLNQPSSGGGLFSSTATPQNQNPFGTSTFSQTQRAPTNTLFGPKPTFPSISSSQSHHSLDNSPQAQSATLQQRIEAVVAAWNPQSPQCRFQHYFYNLVDPQQIAMYGRPANATNDALWRQAVRENPDPSCMVPALAVGFDDLHKRVEAQGKQATHHQEKLKELQSRLSTLSQTHLLSNTLRASRALQAHTLITHRLLRLVEHIHLLIPSLRSMAISPEEEALRAKLERLKDEMQRGLGSGAGRGRMNELWALLGAVKAAKEVGTREGVKWKVVDEEGLERLSMILAEQQQGLAHLTSIINNDMRDLQIMEGGGSAVDGSSAYDLRNGREA